MPALLITLVQKNGPAALDTLAQAVEEQFPGAAYPMESGFVVSTMLSPVQVRGAIAPRLRNGDTLLVAALVRSGWCTAGMSREGNDWFKAYA